MSSTGVSSVLTRIARRIKRRLQPPIPEHGVHAIQVDGLVLHLDLAQHTHRRIAMRRDFEPELTTALARCVRAGDVVADIGSNFGWHSLQLAKNVPRVHKIYAFEPGAVAHGLFTRNLEINAGLSDRIQLQKMAIGAEPGEVTLRQFAGLGTVNASIYPLGDLEYTGEAVPVRPLDALVLEMDSAPAVIKCDVEGAERDVLSGCRKLLGGELGEPPMWFLEANYETSGMAGYFPWQLVDAAAAHAPYVGYVLRDGTVTSMRTRTSLRHGETLVLAVEEVHKGRLQALGSSRGSSGGTA